jgi:RND superfamily putative drug exporter
VGVDGETSGGVTGPLSRAIVALRHVIVLGWVVGAALAVVYLPGLGDSGDLDLPLPDDAAPLAAEARSAEIFGVPLTSRTQVAVRDPEGLDAGEQAALAQFALRVSRGEVPGLEGIAAAVPITNALGLAPGARERSTSVLTYLVFRQPASIPRQVTLGEAYADAAPVPPGAQVGLTGTSPERQGQMSMISDRLPWVVALTLLFIAIVVGLVFSSLVAPLVVLAVVGLAYVVDLHVIGAVAEASGVDAPADIEPVVSALLIGIVTDYAIFYLFGTRARLRAGDSARRAAVGASAHVIAIVATAGVITALGTASLLVGRLDFFRAFAPALALTAIVAVVVAVTLIPALLAILGRGAYWPGGVGRRSPGEADPDGVRPARARAPLAARLLTTRAVAALTALVVGAGLLAAAVQLRDLQLGLGLGSGSGGSSAAVEAGFAPGATAPTELLVEGPGATDPGVLERLQAEVGRQPGVAGVLGPGNPIVRQLPGVFVSEEHEAARMAILLADEPTEHAAIERLDDLEEALPAMLAAAGAPGAGAALAGDTAIAGAAVTAMNDELLRVGVVALAVNLLLVAIFLRALVAPLYLLVANCLSVGATLGIATLVFQDLLDQGQLVYYVPFATAVLLLAMGSDYNIYLVGNIWRLAQRHGIVQGIRTAMAQGARPIAVAGIVLAGSFGMLAIVPVDALHQFAFVMALGILIDAFVVRAILVPALVTVFGATGFWPGRPARPRARPPMEPEGAGTGGAWRRSSTPD